MADKVLKAVAAVLAAVLVVGAFTFAGPCVHEDGSAAACHAAQLGIIVAGAVALVAAVAALFVKNGKVAGAVLVVAACAGLVAAFAPGNVWPLCMMATMRCHVIMQPFAQFVGVAVAAVSLIAAVRAFRAKA